MKDGDTQELTPEERERLNIELQQQYIQQLNRGEVGPDPKDLEEYNAQRG